MGENRRKKKGKQGCFYPRDDLSWWTSPNGHVVVASDLGSEGQRERKVAGEMSWGRCFPEALSHPRCTLQEPLQAQGCRAPHSGKGQVGGVSLFPSGSRPHISTVSTSVGHQPWISQVRSTEL